MAQAVTSTFTGTGQSTPLLVKGIDDRHGTPVNVSLWGTFVATVQVERSFDGSTWLPLTANGTQICSFAAPCSETVEEAEAGVLYRLNCTAYTSGTVNYRLSQ